MINLTKLLLASNVLVLAFFGGLRFHFWQIEALSDKLLVGDNGELPLWEKVKRAISVEDLVSQHVDLNPKGIGKCPFHDDVNPSFSVNDKENYWNCFSGCGGGSVIDFWMKLNDMDFGDAVNDLAARLGIK